MVSDPVVVIGAGPAGISVALSLKDRGVTPLLVERSDQVAPSWRCRYDRLKLNTSRHFSHLPGRSYPRGTALYPGRDEVVAHLNRHAHEDGIELRLGTTVERIDRAAHGWRLSTSDGDLDARIVVVATGFQNIPHLPAYPGSFRGQLLHSSDYRNARPFQDQRVLVVGSGASGMEIAHDLTTQGAAKVWLAVRTPPNIALRSGPYGLPVEVLTLPMYHLPPRLADRIAVANRRRTFGDLSAVGLPIPEEGPFTRAHRLHGAPTIVDPEVIEAVKDGSVHVVSNIAGFIGDEVILVDATRLQPDVVIFATGYRCGVHSLVGHLRPFTDDSHLRPAAWTAPEGLYFHGMLSRPSLIGYLARRSRPLAGRIARQLAASRQPMTGYSSTAAHPSARGAESG